jgi:hypothetical protein
VTVVHAARAELVTAGGDKQTGTWIITGERLRCFCCGSDDIFSISPGTDQTVAANVQPLAKLVLRRGVATRAWCFEHWPARQAAAAE